MRIVLDASMTIAWLFEDERSPTALAALRHVADQGAVVPNLWRLEVANVLRNAVRRHRCDELFVDRSLERLAKFDIKIDAETDDRAWGATRALARDHELTLYDAAYLELAVRLRYPLASGDAALIRAADQRSVTVFAA